MFNSVLSLFSNQNTIQKAHILFSIDSQIVFGRIVFDFFVSTVILEYNFKARNSKSSQGHILDLRVSVGLTLIFEHNFINNIF